MNLERQLAHEIRDHTREALNRLETLVALGEGVASNSILAKASARVGGGVPPSQVDSLATHAAPSLRLLLALLFEVSRLVELVLKRLSTHSQLHLTIKGREMANFQLTAGDSVVVSLTATDVTTGLPAVIDPGSVTAVLSGSIDTVTVDPSGTFITITAAVGGPSTGDTVTVSGTVGGVAADPFVGTYDVTSPVVTPDHFALAGTFGIETAPPSPTATASTATEAPATVNPDGSPVAPAA